MEIYFDSIIRGETARLQVAEPRGETVQPAQSPQHSSRLRQLPLHPALLGLPGALQVQVLCFAEEGLLSVYTIHLIELAGFLPCAKVIARQRDSGAARRRQ